MIWEATWTISCQTQLRTRGRSSHKVSPAALITGILQTKQVCLTEGYRCSCICHRSFRRSHAMRRQEENLRPAAQRARKGERKKRVQLDVGPDHRPATQLDGQSIRALLKDRAPLLRPRQVLTERPLAAQRFQFDANDLVRTSSADVLQHMLLQVCRRSLCFCDGKQC